MRVASFTCKETASSPYSVIRIKDMKNAASAAPSTPRDPHLRVNASHRCCCDSQHSSGSAHVGRIYVRPVGTHKFRFKFNSLEANKVIKSHLFCRNKSFKKLLLNASFCASVYTCFVLYIGITFVISNNSSSTITFFKCLHCF